MPRPAPYTRIPGYCFHSTRNRGYVRLDGRVYYLLGTYAFASDKAVADATAKSMAGLLADVAKLQAQAMKPKKTA